ncbi:MAG: site-specific DNA-methyltransferase [Pirellulales bacterium]|nr:site-specific DNA-methyltransferase [Pirellulales bacterium]
MVHLTEKPVELAVRAMQYSSRAGENVLDLFGGSGSTLIAAEQTGRKAFLMELDPLYWPHETVHRQGVTIQTILKRMRPLMKSLLKTQSQQQPTDQE